MGMYFIYRGAVLESSTFIKFFSIASLINLDELAFAIASLTDGRGNIVI